MDIVRRLRSVVLATLAVLCACGGERIALSSMPVPEIRVLLGTPAEGATLTAPDAWDATGEDGHGFADRGTNLSVVVRPGGDGILFGGSSTNATSIRLRTKGSFVVEMDGARRAYRGSLWLRQQSGRLQVINEVDLETYVAGVILNEMGTTAAPAAYKAQAVLARSYAYFKRKGDPSAPWHVYDDERSQVYAGITIPRDAGATITDLERWTAETRGVILTWKGEPFPTYYASTCGGHTTEASTARLDAAGASPIFLGVPCGYCAPSKYYTWSKAVAVQDLADALKSRGVSPPISRLEWSKVGKGGWVAEVTVTYGPKGAKKVVPGPDFRSAAGLRSMRIDAVEAQADGTLLFRGGGWGHGVGLCQVGAQEMARKGFAPDQILRYYYPGAEFTRLY
ncbi:MAG: SpoIID/LytB domain-containing protein [Planctomycetes bacterium]|nr:SpoIID/LytB domain-containing protein [Planctomycetota bacterium]